MLQAASASEIAHSYRHRVLGIIVAVVLLTPAVGLLLPENVLDNLAVVAMFRGRVFIGLLFSVFFGLLFLRGVLTSRRICWARVRYGGTLKLIPLPGTDQVKVERFLEMVRKDVVSFKQSQ